MPSPAHSSTREAAVAGRPEVSANDSANDYADEWVDDDDDDDMEYEPEPEPIENETQDNEDEDGMEFLDAEETIQDSRTVNLLDLLSGDGDMTIELEGTMEDGAEGSGLGTGDGPAARPQLMTINRSQLLRLITHQPMLRRLFQSPAPPDDEEDEETETNTRRTRAGGRLNRTSSDPRVPSSVGRELMESGTFGTNEKLAGQFDRKKRLAVRIMRRELGLDSPGKERLANRIASQGMIPSSNADTIIHYDSRCYSGQFSDDGNFFFSCSQDFQVRMYDTSNPYNWRYYKAVSYNGGQWTITDASLSPDNKYLAYSSMNHQVCLASTDPGDDAEPHHLDFSAMPGQQRRAYNGHRPGSFFSVFSIRFSGDGREIVAGTSDRSVYVYDIESRQSILRIRAHDDEVNAVCFGDKSSPHLLYSGSDDTTLKVWDRRSMSDSRAAGVFLGHTEGLTYVDSKGDGRYVLSNGKDQNMKLWDLRKMMSSEKAQNIDLSQFSTGFDYRWHSYDNVYRKHPNDCSLVTYRGHKVLKTLIRCHFSPPGSTDSRYVYSGSEDGSVYIYNMDATLAGKVDVTMATENTRPRGAMNPRYDYDDRHGGPWMTCVRDASWHPNAPVIAATSWNGYGAGLGTCTVHTWNDGQEDDEADPKMGLRVNAKLQRDPHFYNEPQGGGACNSGARTQYARTRLRTRTENVDEANDAAES